MSNASREWAAHPSGEQPTVDAQSAITDTFAGRVHVEWDATAPVTSFGQLPFLIDYLKRGGLFDGWVDSCPLVLTSRNASRKRDLLGSVVLSVLVGHHRYAHIAALRCDPVNPGLLGMQKVVSEMVEEAAQNVLDGDLETALGQLLGVVNATIGFDVLSAETGIPKTSLMRMLSEAGNPRAANLAAILKVVGRNAGVLISVRAHVGQR